MLALPWTLPDPERGKPRGAFDCETCQHPKTGLSRAVRAKMHCGFMPQSEWKAGRNGLPPSFGGRVYDCNICPGWVVRRPGVAEAAAAYQDAKDGILAQTHPNLTRDLIEGIHMARAAFNLHEAEVQRQFSRRIGPA